MNHDIFISYSSKQKSIADGVCHYLEENGFKCWMAPRDIPVGSDYGDLIEEAIKTSKVVVLVFSQTASISKWVKGEINVAFTEDKSILPFRIDETEITGGFRVMLNQMHWIDAFPRYADRLPDLLNSVCGFLGRQPQKVTDDSERMEAERKAEQERLERERAEAQRKAQQQKVANLTSPSANAKPKPKKGLWIGIGAAVVVGLVLMLTLPKKQPLSVSGSYNGHDYVDLGLPSGTLWATCNIGASTPEGYGDYYAWGETSTNSIYNRDSGWQTPSSATLARAATTGRVCSTQAARTTRGSSTSIRTVTAWAAATGASVDPSGCFCANHEKQKMPQPSKSLPFRPTLDA